jgi:catechol 2,3-dioxygenase
MSTALQSKVEASTVPVDANGHFNMAVAPHRIGIVSLAVRDIATVSKFYQTVLGLKLIEATADGERLGVGDTVLLTLLNRPNATPQSRRDAGLFHTAFLLPTRKDLGSWLRFAAQSRVSIQGASDHLVSEAVYLADPEGNGIEIYADRPVAKWPMRDGAIEMATERLDLDNLMQDAAGQAWNGYPAGGIIGHVHLQVGATAAADAFYETLLHFDVMARYPGASFFGSGGYHHQLAGNIWNSRGAPVRQPGMTGLAGVELLTPDQSVIDGTRERLTAAGHGFTDTADGLDVLDPWGIAISLRLKAGAPA